MGGTLVSLGDFTDCLIYDYEVFSLLTVNLRVTSGYMVILAGELHKYLNYDKC